MWVALSQRPEETKKLTLPCVRGNSSCLTAFELEYQLLSAFGLRMEPQHQLFCVSACQLP